MGTGRPRKEIDQKQFESLCGMQCTELEICDWFDVTDKTLDKWCHEVYDKPFSVVFRAKREKGKISLRRKLWQHIDNNPSACIFACKNILGYTDRIQTDTNLNVDSSVDMMKEYLQGKKDGK